MDFAEVANYHDGKPAYFYTYPSDYISDLIRKGNIWEPYLHRIFEQFVTSDSVVIEAGCHIGTHSVKLGKLCNELILFEPLPSSNKLLCQNLKANNISNATVIQKGLSNTNGTTRFAWIPNSNFGGAGLDNNPMGVPEWTTAPQEQINVELTTIDSLNLQKLDFMKIDVEGYEPNVIKGGMDTFARCKPVIVLECWANHHGQVNENYTRMLFRDLLEIGYDLIHIQGPDFMFIPKK